MTSKASSQPRSNTGLPRSSPSMANTDTPDQALRDLRLNGGVSSSIHDPASQTTTPAGGASDDASVASSSRPRKHRRGGRKKKTRMAPPVEESRLPWSERLDEGMSGLEDGHAGQVNGKEVKEMPNADDVSENVSVASSSQPRRHKRGGRKKKSHMAPVNEAEARVPWSERVGRLGEELGGSGKEKAGPAGGQQNLEKEKGKGKGKLKEGLVDREQKPVQDGERTSDTGVRAFNIRRAQGGKPFGISIDRDGDGEGQGEKSAGENGEEEGRKEEKKKPVSIRLDLNLEIEIFLKAKIKGDVTITFLE